jgi:glucose/arabinose dehydrogenase
VADARDGLRMPRRLLEVAPGQFWIVDMGSWEPHRGRLLRLNTAGQPGDPRRLQPLAEKLDRPHGMAIGPDQQMYIGEATRIWRTSVNGALHQETVVDKLPGDGAHPLKEFVFGDHGKLWINVGSSTDACRNAATQPDLPCLETQGEQPRAAVYLATLGGKNFGLQSLRPFARGLRNSLGLAVTRDKTSQAERLWQAENSVDYTDATAPAEELNLLKEGFNHGWPTCVSDVKGRNQVARGYEGRVKCHSATITPPTQAWPAHVAPLQLMAVPHGAKSLTPAPWSGHLLAAWHGYRANGHRIVGWALGPEGMPRGPRRDFVAGWDAKAGVRPLGNPAGITVDSQGRLWIVEDRNRTVILIAPAQPAFSPR